MKYVMIFFLFALAGCGFVGMEKTMEETGVHMDIEVNKPPVVGQPVKQEAVAK